MILDGMGWDGMDFGEMGQTPPERLIPRSTPKCGMKSDMGSDNEG